MEAKNNKYITVTYELFVIGDDTKPHLVEKAPAEKPFQFISGFGITLEGFEAAIAPLEQGATFDFTLPKEQAYGEYVAERVLDLDKDIFSINGHFDHENIYKNAIVPLQNEDGNHFMGRVLDITDDKVKMDLNHPLASKALNFKGHVVETREATNEEIQNMVNHLSGEHCGCEDCGGDCGDKHQHGGCGCGHCH